MAERAILFVDGNNLYHGLKSTGVTSQALLDHRKIAENAAYILSADGDFTHAAQFVRSLGKKVFAVAATSGAQLAAAVNSFIRVDAAWFDDCYKGTA